MTVNLEAANKVLAQIDRDELAQLGCDLTSIPSPTGQEKAIGEFILDWFQANGLKAVRQDVEFDRPTDFDGQFLTFRDGVRGSDQPDGAGPMPEVAFFGGSGR